MTIQEVVNSLGAVAALQAGKGCDKFHAGDGGDVVRGIVVTFMATRDVLAEAVRLGANLIVTHEPTFYTDEDPQKLLAGDPVYESKRQYIQQHGLTIWRCHDWWHRVKPDGILMGMAHQLGWTPYQDAAAPEVFTLPATTLEQLSQQLRQTFKRPSFRVIGDPRLPVRRVGLSCGCPWWHSHRRLLREHAVDVLVCGELREWETCEYVRDSAAAGLRQGLIVLGHCISEEGGMAFLADWLRQRIAEVAIHFVPAGDPFRQA